MDFDSQLSTYMPTYPEQELGECSLVRIHPDKLLERVRILSLVKFCQNLPCAQTFPDHVLGYSLSPKLGPRVKYDPAPH